MPDLTNVKRYKNSDQPANSAMNEEGQAMDCANIINATKGTGWINDFTDNCELVLLSKMKELGGELSKLQRDEHKKNSACSTYHSRKGSNEEQ